MYLEFSDGTKGNLHFKGLLTGEVFEPLNRESFFIQYGLTDYTLEWNNGADFAPEYLRDQVIKQKQLEAVQ